jgi:hypothetical protein
MMKVMRRFHGLYGLTAGVVLFSGCTFPAGNARDAAITDAKLVDGTETIGVDARPTPVNCSTNNSANLILCLELEDGVTDGTLLDSTVNRHDAAVANVATAVRPTAPSGVSNALRVSPSSSIRIAEDSDFDLNAAYTVAMWIEKHNLPWRLELTPTMAH